jgi:uroporphyrinogen III methyltransferase/synthase
VLLPRAAVARDILPRTLEERGAAVEVVTVYETGLPAPERTREGLRALEAGEVDVLTFTSASTAENFADIIGGERLDRLCQGLVVVAIGPVTREACRRVGLEVHVMPERYTLAAMTEALVRYLAAQQT